MAQVIPGDIVDISEHQIDTDLSKATGVDGFIIRTGYGDDIKSQDDLYANHNMDQCEKLGKPYMTYLYSYAGNAKQNQSEIAHEKRMTAGRKTLGHILDLEEWSLRGNGKAAAEAWLAAFPDNGYIYAGQAWWNGPLKGLECKRWIPAYGNNSGKPETAFKPKMEMVGWQYTSRAHVPGIKGNVDRSEWYVPFGGKTVEKAAAAPAAGPRVVYKKEVALLLFVHLCTHDKHGYTMDMDDRQGAGEEVVDIYGHKYTIKSGDRDCSSAIISAFEAAGISCGGATYTGNMRKCMVASGNFEVKPMSYTAQGSDVYLNEKSHTAMCISAVPDVLGQFSINEKGTGYGGKVGDQLQKGEYDSTYGRGESHLRKYYDFPWDLILHCKNNEVAFVIGNDETAGDKKTETTTTAPAQKAAGPSETAVLAAKVILGDYNKGDARRVALGPKYTPVQTRVNKAYTPENKEKLIRAMAECIDKF